MNKIIDHNFAFAILILIAACVGFYFYLDNVIHEMDDLYGYNQRSSSDKGVDKNHIVSSSNNLTFQSVDSRKIVCEEDKKQCLDGSYVSRSGSNCEFEECINDANIISSYPDPTWKTYRDSHVEFKYPVTFCGTSWQEPWDTHSCRGEWLIEKTKGASSSSPYAGGEKNPTGRFIHIMPSYSSFGFEFGGDIQIELISKEDFDYQLKYSKLEKNESNGKYEMYFWKTEDYGYIRDVYIVNGLNYIAIHNYFPDRYQKYFEYLIHSIILKD